MDDLASTIKTISAITYRCRHGNEETELGFFFSIKTYCIQEGPKIKKPIGRNNRSQIVVINNRVNRAGLVHKE